jgi:hypothetical protein
MGGVEARHRHQAGHLEHGVGCGGDATRRRCRVRSKSGSRVQRGVARRPGGSTGWRRKIGTKRVARSRRSTRVSHSGDRSSQATATIVDLSTGSLSMYHENASLSRMN